MADKTRLALFISLLNDFSSRGSDEVKQFQDMDLTPVIDDLYGKDSTWDDIVEIMEKEVIEYMKKEREYFE